ncbi:MAG: hypothetical protein KBE22_07740, partial [Candidatus Accumulibacter sp.]|nr:hypothetical protein [Accumulibacter sp.]
MSRLRDFHSTLRRKLPDGQQRRKFSGASDDQAVNHLGIRNLLLERNMDRRQSLKWLSGFPAFILPIAAPGPTWAGENAAGKLQKTKAEWAALLPQPAYRVLFE